MTNNTLSSNGDHHIKHTRTVNDHDVLITPSIICTDMVNFEKQANDFIDMGIPFLHADISDGQFCPSELLTFDILDKTPSIMDFPLDFHIMALDSEPLVIKALTYNAYQICFHWESTHHVDRLLNIIKEHNVRCGIALTPTTPICVLEYAVEICDFILLMLINPGYASMNSEKQVKYAVRKISDCYRFLHEHNRIISIEVDGRVSCDSIPGLVAAGSNILVAGSTSLFKKDATIKDNYQMMLKAVTEGLNNRSAWNE